MTGLLYGTALGFAYFWGLRHSISQLGSSRDPRAWMMMSTGVRLLLLWLALFALARLNPHSLWLACPGLLLGRGFAFRRLQWS